MSFQILSKRKKTRLSLVSGFTMIEAFVAITVLLIAVLGPLTLLTRAINDGNYAKNQVTSSFLLQEGLDLVVAESSRLSASSQFSSLGSVCVYVSPCRIFLASKKTVTIDSSSDFSLYTDINGVYSHDTSGSATKTIFTRKVWFEDVNDGVVGRFTSPTIAKKAFVETSWTTKGLTRTQQSSVIVYNSYE
ncbi:MAG: hypothetical protein WCW56_02540 [Candidatus Paceibacterota bacterium]|jgi:Tfp pilus assembly protein PilV